MILTFGLLTALMAIFTLMPLSKNQHWVVRGMDFPRFQFCVMLIILFVMQYLFLPLQNLTTWGILLTNIGCLIWQLWWVLPYTPLCPKEVKSAGNTDERCQLSIITANVLMTNKQASKLIHVVKQYQPDILVTLESDKWWEKALTPIEESMPYTIKCPQDNLYGMHLYSKIPFNEQTLSFLVEDGIPSMHVSMTLNDEEIRLHFLHPAPPSPTENVESTERDAELLVVAKSITNTKTPTIVTGDLNDVAWSKTTRLFRKTSGLLDPRVGRGMFNTFNANYFFLRWPLDHLFISRHFTLNTIKRLPSIGSDHFALFTKVSLTPQAGKNQEGIKRTAQDNEQTDEIINHTSVTKEDVPKPGGN